MNFWEVTKIFKNTLFQSTPLSWSILFSSVMGVSTLSMAWFALFYFNHIGLDLMEIAIMWFALNSSVGVISWFVAHIQKALGKTGTAYLIGFGLSGTFFLLSFITESWILIFLIIFYMIRGIATPVLREYINVLCESDVRATVMSIRSFVIRILFFIISPTLGYIQDIYSIQEALLVMGVFCLIGGGASLVMLKRLKFI